MKLQQIKHDFNRGQMKIEDIDWLISNMEQLKSENHLLKTKHWYKVYEENLKLAQTVLRLEKMQNISVTNSKSQQSELEHYQRILDSIDQVALNSGSPLGIIIHNIIKSEIRRKGLRI